MKGFFIILFTLLFTVGYGQNSVYFTSDPVLSPDGSKIIFAFNGDLWMVQSDGGLAQNLTSLDGFESDPIISPDGHWLAFTSIYTLDGADLELTGVKPDIEIHNTFKDRLEGNDPQLDRAIEIIMSEMQK